MQQYWKFSGNISYKLLCWSLLYITALLPFQKPGVPIVAGVALFVVAWLISGDLKDKLRVFISNKTAVLFASLYLVYCIGIFYSANTEYALTDLLLKCPLLLFPLIVSSVSFTKNKDAFLKTFLYSCLVSAVIILVRAGWLTHSTGKNYFFYSTLSWLMHVGHYAMYLCFAAFIALYFFSREESGRKKIGWIVSFAFLMVTILLLSARAQLLAFFLVGFGGIIIYFVREKKWLQGSLVLFGAAVILSAALWLFPLVKDRIVAAKNETNNFLKKEPQANTSVSTRFMIWESAMEVVKHHPVFGVGTGDGKDELLKEAGAKGYTILVEKNVNYHNQFLQAMAVTGIPGLLLLSGSVIAGIVTGIKRKDYLGIAFFTIIIISFLTESVLERQTGVIFYSLFSALLILAGSAEKNAQFS